MNLHPAYRGFGFLHSSGDESIPGDTPGNTAGNNALTLDHRRASLQSCRGSTPIDWEADAAGPEESCLVR